MVELKPCPFCGGRVYVSYWSKTERCYINHYARKKPCVIDTIELTDGIKTLAEAATAWNRRAEQ